MSAATDRLRAIGLYSPYAITDQAHRDGAGHGVYITYRPRETGRFRGNAAWQVIRPGFKTDPDGHWMDNGHKTFDVYGWDKKSARRDAAIEWANNTFGTVEWVSIPGMPRSLFPAEVAAWVKVRLRDAARVSAP